MPGPTPAAPGAAVAAPEAPAHAPVGAASRDGREGLRKDIQGLRTIAVLSVVLWHAGLPFVPGGFVGVDVFFVISGFLMTQLLVRELEQHRRISISGFYARRARRLLPAAAVTLLGVLALTVIALPADRWRGIGYDIVASALYLVNWRLADTSVDYLAEGSAASPVQHFWSLAVEEQYYAFWPVLLALAGWAVLRAGRGRGLRLSLGLLLLGITAASYAWSVSYTQQQPERAYFVTTTRLWELGLGGLVAVAAPWLLRHRLSRPAANAVVGLGLGAIAVSLVLLDAGTAFPGWVAVVPTLGTAAVIAAGPLSGGRTDPVRLLAPAPVQWVGALSYSLYLWHWPLLVAATARTADGELSTRAGLAVAACSVVPAWLSLRLVEDPIRRVKPVAGRSFALPSLRLGAACTALSLVAGAGLLGWTALEQRRQADLVDVALGAGALTGGGTFEPVDEADFLVPSPALAADDIFHPWYDGKCSPGDASDEPRTCLYGDPRGSFRVVVIGDSHAVMWLPALEPLARERGWRLEVIAKSNCPLADTVVMRKKQRNRVCASWNEAVHQELAADPPDVVITAQVNVYTLPGVAPGEEREVFGEALARSWTRLARTGARVMTIVDGPRWERSPVECAALNAGSLRSCARPKHEVLTRNNASQTTALRLAPRVEAIDVTRWLCPGDSCPVVIGNVLVYRDNNHISATYARTLTPHLAEALKHVEERAG